MTELPWVLIPAFLVAAYLIAHLAAIVKILHAGSDLR